MEDGAEEGAGKAAANDGDLGDDEEADYGAGDGEDEAGPGQLTAESFVELEDAMGLGTEQTCEWLNEVIKKFWLTSAQGEPSFKPAARGID